jgi:iron complex transport system substrate-binding protein
MSPDACVCVGDTCPRRKGGSFRHLRVSQRAHFVLLRTLEDEMTKHNRRPVRLAWLVLVVSVTATACSSGSSRTFSASDSSLGSTGAFPVTVHVTNGAVTITTRPSAIVSLSPTATEMLAAIGALSQVKAVDQNSNYPPNAPRSGLDATQPNIEAIAALHPDLVVMAGDTTGFIPKLAAFNIPVLSLPAAATLADTDAELTALGKATGHAPQAATQVADITTGIAKAVSSVHHSGPDLTYYYELDQTYYSATSSTFIGSVLGMLGLQSVADPAAKASDGGYPQLSAEYIIKANPDFVFLADSGCCGQTPAVVAARPGWAGLRAVTGHHVVVLNDDIASRWGPRIVDLAQTVVAAVAPTGQSPTP